MKPILSILLTTTLLLTSGCSESEPQTRPSTDTTATEQTDTDQRIADVSGEILDKTKELGALTVEKSKQVYESTKSTSKNAWDKTKEVTKSTVNKTKELGSSAVDKSKEIYHDAKEKTIELYDDATKEETPPAPAEARDI